MEQNSFTFDNFEQISRNLRKFAYSVITNLQVGSFGEEKIRTLDKNKIRFRKQTPTKYGLQLFKIKNFGEKFSCRKKIEKIKEF